jgi:1,5-anhydro-D-fructose reductase (1,5-anhydro-D-mannitol-forming)
MVRYGILGFGHHAAKRLVPAFAETKNSLLSGLWRRDAIKAQANAREFGVPRAFRSAEELCASREIDAVFITSPDALHLPDALLAFRHGKPVLCEKPLAMNAAQVEAMLAAAAQANVKFGVAQNFRWNRSVNLIRDWLRLGKIGSPRFASAQFSFQGERSPRAWIADPSLACGGPIGDVGIHCIDALRYILDQDILAVATLAHTDEHSGGLDANAVLALDFSRGVLGCSMVGFRSEYRSFLEIAGEDGTLQSEHGLFVEGPVEVRLVQSGKILAHETVVNTDAYSRMLDAFSGWVEGRGEFAASAQDGLHNQRVLDAAYASWRSGRKEMVAP